MFHGPYSLEKQPKKRLACPEMGWLAKMLLAYEAQASSDEKIYI